MSALEFTGADLRDWHLRVVSEEEHEEFDQLLEASAVLSWERIALGLRGVLGPAYLAEATGSEDPAHVDGMKLIFGVLLHGLSLGASVAAAEFAAAAVGLTGGEVL